MPTLSELAKTQQQTSVASAQGGSASFAGGTSIRPQQVGQQKTVDNTAGLIKDIGKMFGGVLQSHQEASEYAGKRVGTDNLVAYKRDMTQVANAYANKAEVTSSDMIEKTRIEQGIYEMYLQKGHFGDNDLANQAFRDTYADPAAQDVLGLKGTNNTNRVALFKTETKRDVSEQINTLGVTMSQTTIDTFKEQYKSAGLDPLAVDTLVLNAKGEILASEINNNHAKYYDAGGNVNSDAVEDLIWTTYSHYINSDNEIIQGQIAKVGTTTNKFVETQANETKVNYTNEATHRADSLMYPDTPYVDEVTGRDYRFASTAAEYIKVLDEEYPLLTTENRNQLIKKYHEKRVTGSTQKNIEAKDWRWDFNRTVAEPTDANKFVPPEVIAEKLAKGLKIYNSPLTSPSEKLNMGHDVAELRTVQLNYGKIFGEIKGLVGGSMSIENAKENVKTGTMRDGLLVTTTQYQGLYKDYIQKTTANTANMDMTQDGAKKNFAKSLQELSRVQLALDGSTTPKFFNKFDQVLKDRTAMRDWSANDIRQFVTYMDYQNTANPAQYADYQINVAQIMVEINRLDADTETSPAVKESTLKTFASTTLQYQATPKNANKMWRDTLDKVRTGDTYLGTWVNTEGAQGLEYTMQSIYMGQYTEDSMDKFVNSYEFYDSSSRFKLSDNQRVLKPKNMTNNEMTELIEYHLKPEGITANDVTLTAFRKVSSTGSVNIGYNVMQRSAKTGMLTSLGEISSDAYNKMKREK